MYTSYIGNKFLDIYRQRNNLPDDFTARQFFDEVLFPLFFDDDEHLMHVGNSPFFQKPTKSAIEEHGSKSKAQLFNFHAKIEGGVPSGAIYVGYGAENIVATSSGQLTSMPISIQYDEMYASWIGQALAIGLSGGFAIQINREEVLWRLYEGWHLYRKYLSQTINLKDKQIETWNGQWLSFAFGNNYDENNKEVFFQYLEPETVQGNFAIPTIDWQKVVFALSKIYPKKVLTAYAFNLSQTNTTLGFINIYLPKVRELFDLQEQLYQYIDDRIYYKDFEEMYSTFYNFRSACMLGTIGMKTLEPAKLRDYMPIGTAKYAKGKDYKFSDIKLKPKKDEVDEDYVKRITKAKKKYKEELINFQIFKTWIIAMLNNKKELNALAEQVAQALIDFEDNAQKSESSRGKSKQSRITEDVKSSKTLKTFIENITTLMSKHKEGARIFKQVKDAVIELPSDLFPLFITLIRFEYQYKKSI